MADRSGIHIARMREPHLREVFTLIDREHWGWEFAEIQEIHRLDADSSVVALDGRDIVGLVTCVDYGTLAFIVHVIVRKGWRGKGIGVRMLESVLPELDSRGVRTVELHANPEVSHFYHQFSFKRLEEVAYIVREPPKEPHTPQGEAADSGLSWLPREGTAGMAEVMSSSLGYDKGDMTRALSKSPPHLALARREAGRTTALLVSRTTKELSAAGPWVMEEPDAASAETMLRMFLSRAPAKRMDILAPASNAASVAAFKACGFTMARAGIVRMSRSSEPQRKSSESVLSLGHVGMI